MLTIETEPLWRQARRLFDLRGRTLHMEATTVGSQLAGIEHDDEPTCIADFQQIRQAIAPGFGCDHDEILVTNSTTDSISKVMAGLELSPGDEVLTTNHENWGGLAPLAIARDRHSIVIKKIKVPVGNGQRAEDYVERFADAISERTKVLMFSSPTATTGTLLPIQMLARLAQQRGLITIVDGAHLPGMMNVGFHQLGVDFLAGSGYKWQCGPGGTALLYVRNKVLPQFNPQPLPKLWPVISIWYPLEGGLPPRGAGPEPAYDIAEYLQNTGSASVGRMHAFQKACQTWDRLGRKRIEEHLLELSAYLKQRISEFWGDAALYSPSDDPRLATALTTFNPFRKQDDAFDGDRFEEFVNRLQSEFQIVVKHTQFFVADEAAERHAVRIATRVYHTRDDVDCLIEAMRKLSAQLQ